MMDGRCAWATKRLRSSHPPPVDPHIDPPPPSPTQLQRGVEPSIDLRPLNRPLLGIRGRGSWAVMVSWTWRERFCAHRPFEPLFWREAAAAEGKREQEGESRPNWGRRHSTPVLGLHDDHRWRNDQVVDQWGFDLLDSFLPKGVSNPHPAARPIRSRSRRRVKCFPRERLATFLARGAAAAVEEKEEEAIDTMTAVLDSEVWAGQWTVPPAQRSSSRVPVISGIGAPDGSIVPSAGSNA